METIRNYLENMFMNLPRTSDVLKAKSELGQMMEDKYNELRESGKSDNEAVGIVISEFGNLEELADDLGIHDYVKPQKMKQGRLLSMEQAKQYISDRISASVRLAIATFLCICSPAVIIFSQMAGGSDGDIGNAPTAVGMFFFFLFLIVAIGIFIFTGINSRQWDYIKYEPLQMDFATENFMRSQMENFRSLYAVLVAVGVILCVASVVPAAVIGSLGIEEGFLEMLSGALVLVIVAVGVMLITIAGVRQRAYETLLHLNGYHRRYTHGSSRLERSIMSVYWPSVVCLYLIISFLTYRWDITWIIWPIAAVISRVIRISCDEDDHLQQGGK